MKVMQWLLGISIICVLFCRQGILIAENKLYFQHDKGLITYVEGKDEYNVETGSDVYFIKANGAAISTAKNEAQRKVLAKRGAMIDAQRNLLEIIKGSNVESNTIMNQSMRGNSKVTSSIEGLIKGAIIVPGSDEWDGNTYTLEMQIPFEKRFSKSLEDVEKTESAQNPNIPPKRRNKDAAPYTGLLIDARDLEITPGMFINIYNEKLENIWRRIHPVYKVSFHKLKNIKDEKVGTNPLRVYAKSITGDYGVNIIVNNSNADEIKNEIVKTDLLKKGKVIIVID